MRCRKRLDVLQDCCHVRRNRPFVVILVLELIQSERHTLSDEACLLVDKLARIRGKLATVFAPTLEPREIPTIVRIRAIVI